MDGISKRCSCFFVPCCFLQKVLAENVHILIPLHQEFRTTNPRESNNHFVIPKIEVPPISHTPATTEFVSVAHSDTSTHVLALYLSHLSSTTKKTNNSKSHTALWHTSESKGGSSQSQSWYKQDAVLGKEERHMLPLFFVLS